MWRRCVLRWRQESAEKGVEACENGEEGYAERSMLVVGGELGNDTVGESLSSEATTAFLSSSHVLFVERGKGGVAYTYARGRTRCFMWRASGSGLPRR